MTKRVPRSFKAFSKSYEKAMGLVQRGVRLENIIPHIASSK
jgi:hypothetical protein